MQDHRPAQRTVVLPTRYSCKNTGADCSRRSEARVAQGRPIVTAGAPGESAPGVSSVAGKRQTALIARTLLALIRIRCADSPITAP
jgi:hypothetical protein